MIRTSYLSFLARQDHWFDSLSELDLHGAVSGPDSEFVAARLLKKDRFRAIADKGEKAVVFVVSGGGAKGIAAWGALTSLAESEVKPDAIFATSAGSFCGAYFASWGGDREKIREANELLSIFNWTDIFRFDLSLSGFFSFDKLRDFLDTIFSDRLLEFLPIAFVPMGACLLPGDPVPLLTAYAEGKLVDSLTAACSLLGVVKPGRHGNEIHLDGSARRDDGYDPLDLARALFPKSLIIHIRLGMARHFDSDKYDNGVVTLQPFGIYEPLVLDYARQTVLRKETYLQRGVDVALQRMKTIDRQLRERGLA